MNVIYKSNMKVAVYNGTYYTRLDDGCYLSPKGTKLHEDIYKAERGEIPSGATVVFADGDISNNNPHNLILQLPTKVLKSSKGKKGEQIKQTDGAKKE